MVCKTVQAKIAMVYFSFLIYSTLKIRIPYYMMTYYVPYYQNTIFKSGNKFHIYPLKAHAWIFKFLECFLYFITE